MKGQYILFLFLSISSLISAQERFVNLYPGWRANNAMQFEDGYLIMGLDTLNTYENTVHFVSTDIIGNQSSYTRLIIDTIDAIDVHSSKSYFISEGVITIGGNYKVYDKGYDLCPLIMYFNKDSFNLDSLENLKVYFGDKSARLICLIDRGDKILICGDVQYTLDANVRTYFGVFDKNTRYLTYKDYVRPNNCVMTPYQIFPTTDGGYIISCEQDITYALPKRIYACILKVDSEGNEQWRHVIRGRTDVPLYYDFEAVTYRPRVFNSPDGNYWVVWTDPEISTGNTMQSNPESSVRIAKLTDYNDSCTLTGERSLMVEFDNPDLNWWVINDSHQAGNGDMYLLLKNLWGIRSALAKIHANGVGAWFRTYKCYPDDDAESSNTELIGLTRTDDGGFMLTGAFRSTSSTMFPGGMIASVVFKVDSCGCFEAEGCNDHCMDSYSEHYVYMQEASIYPNPAKDKITVNFDYVGSKDTEFEYSIYNVDGKQILNDKSKACDLAIGTCNLKIDICDLPSGYYMIQLWGGGKIFTGRFVKE